MYTNMNFPAPLAVLGFVALCGGLAAAVLTTAVALFVGKPRVVRWTWRLTAVAGIVYLLALIGFAIVSRERLLHQGEEKYFCELDCHLAYSLVSVKQSATPGPTTEYQVTVRTRFDRATISEHRGNGPLTPNPRIVRLIDSAGHQYAPSSNNDQIAFAAALRPGEAYNVEITFTVPSDAKNLKLLITTEQWPERLLIGDENSPLHARTYFALST
jgi:hypothetical protein